MPLMAVTNNTFILLMIASKLCFHAILSDAKIYKLFILFRITKEWTGGNKNATSYTRTNTLPPRDSSIYEQTDDKSSRQGIYQHIQFNN